MLNRNQSIAHKAKNTHSQRKWHIHIETANGYETQDQIVNLANYAHYMVLQFSNQVYEELLPPLPFFSVF
jgi:hypothetical protein